MTTGTLSLSPVRRQNQPGRPTSSATIQVEFAPAWRCGPWGQTEAGFLFGGSASDLFFETAAVSFDGIASGDYVLTVGRVQALREGGDEDDRPTEYAISCALRTLQSAARLLRLGFPRASASVGPSGGIRLTWSYGRKEVRFVCGGAAANKSYIYSECGADHDVDHTIDGNRLAQHLAWVLREA